MPENHSDQGPPDTGPIYEPLAAKYASVVDTKPHNAYYERPAMLALFPTLAGQRILDAGCGAGWYTEHFVNNGAIVTACDAAPTFVKLTRARAGERARVVQADLNQPLTFAADAAFDLVVCPLTLHYVKNWEDVLAEFRRVLRAGGLLIFSTHHPFMDWQLFEIDDYFATWLIEDDWQIGKVWFYHRPLTAITEALATAGFVIERLVEPQPTAEFRRVDPEGYERLSKNPWFLLIRARRD